jgi:microcystin-dependent protein
LLLINENQALFSILGTTYGGNGQTTFALPNLQARCPVHVGNGITLGQSGGEATHTLNLSELPAHNHPPVGSSNTATDPAPTGDVWPTDPNNPFAANGNASMNPICITAVGGSQPHQNMSPFLVLNFVIALAGIFPPRV